MISSLLEESEWYYDQWRVEADIFREVHSKVMNMDIAHLSKDELFSWMKKYYDNFTSQYLINEFVEPISFYFQQNLKWLLEKEWIKWEIVEEFLAYFWQSSKPNYIKQCIDEYKNNPENIDFILEKYHYIKNDYSGVKKVEKQDIEELVEQSIHTKFCKEPNMNNVSVGANKLLNALRFISTVQDVRKAESLMWVSGAMRLLWEWSKRINLSLEDLLMATWEEIFRDNLKENVLSERKECCVISWWISDIETYSREESWKITNDLKEYLLKNYPDISEISGISASKWKVQWRAVVILDSNDFHLLKKDDVLVTSMTRPEYLPIMYLASAFITDEGGITSHAAIVAREINKPCIIGMRVATKIIKTGDFIEVDADNGVVRILTK